MIKNTIFLLSLTALFVGCTSNYTYVFSDKTIYEDAQKNNLQSQTKKYKDILEEQSLQVDDSTSIDMNQALMDFYNEWKNVRYRLGGNSKKGIDCSAFTQRIFKEKFDMNIPRTTRTQVKVGKKIKKSELEMGDLVFFKTGRTDRHVGIYMGDGSFMHASIKGIKFTKLDKPYYKRKYWTSRRIFD